MIYDLYGKIKECAVILTEEEKLKAYSSGESGCKEIKELEVKIPVEIEELIEEICLKKGEFKVITDELVFFLESAEKKYREAVNSKKENDFRYSSEFKEGINKESYFEMLNEKELEKYVKFLNEYIIKVKYFELYMCVGVNKLGKKVNKKAIEQLISI